MRPLNRRERPSRRTYRPDLEGLESRDVPSVASPLASAQDPAPTPYLALVRRLEARLSGNGGHSAGTVHSLGRVAHNPPPAARDVDPSPIPGFVQMLYAPVTTTVPINVQGKVFPPGTYAVPQPTAAEIKRETFVGRFSGRYYIGPPRFSNQAETIHVYSDGKNATSNQFLRARAQLLLFPPADPNAKPTTNDPVAGQVVGLTTFYPTNTLSTGNVLFLDATNVPGVASNDPKALDHGLPSHLAVAFDALSGGIYAAPEFITTPPQVTDATTGAPIVPLPGASAGAVSTFATGTGILDVKYFPDTHRRPGTLGSGTAVITVQALMNNTGANYSQNRRIN
jgi:hypothetical protein